MAIVQEPTETPFPDMPESALAHVDVDYCLPSAQIGELLDTLVASPETVDGAPPGEDATLEHEVKGLTMHEDEREHPADPSPYSCPECGGVLWEIKDGEILRFRCRVGHAYTSDTLTGDQAATVEHSLWTALRALEEQAAVKRRIAERARRQGHVMTADRFGQGVRELEAQAQTVRDLLMSGVGANED